MKNSPSQKRSIYEVDGIKYRCHPIYDLYAASRCGKIIQKPLVGNLINTGYLLCMVRRSDDVTQKHYLMHRFIWETYNCVIPDDYVVDHLNGNKTDSRLKNLQLVTPQQNTKKYYNEHYHKKGGKGRIKATNLKSNRISYFPSMYSAGKKILINRTSIYYVCSGRTKTSYSDKMKCRFTFEFVLSVSEQLDSSDDCD